MSTRSKSSCVICAIAAVFLFICVSVLAPPVPAFSAYPMTVKDALGRTITLHAPPQRIISVAPSVTEILFALGLDPLIVGISAADDYPPEKVGAKTKVGGVVLDVERIVRLAPDLILGVANLQRGQLERLIALHLPVVAVDAKTLPEVYRQIALIAKLSGRIDAGTALVTAMRRREQVVRRAVSGRRTPRVYVEISGEPLMTAGEGTFITDLVFRAGGRNVFGDLHGWQEVSEEAVVRRNPDVIVLTYPQVSRVLTRRGWEHVNAVRRQRVGVISAPLVSRPGPRLVGGLDQLARIIHPEAFR